MANFSHFLICCEYLILTWEAQYPILPGYANKTTIYRVIRAEGEGSKITHRLLLLKVLSRGPCFFPVIWREGKKVGSGIAMGLLIKDICTDWLKWTSVISFSTAYSPNPWVKAGTLKTRYEHENTFLLFGNSLLAVKPLTTTGCSQTNPSLG